MNNDEVLISVIVPAYNAQGTIVNCLKSIKEQTYQNYEVIIVDDGSSDETLKLCKDICSVDARFCVISIQNQGVSNARNVGINNAHGKICCFVDSDDYVSELFLEKIIRPFREMKCDLVVVGYDLIENEKKIGSFSYGGSDRITKRDELIDGLVTTGQFEGFLCNKAFKKSIIDEEKIQLDIRTLSCEDTLFCLKYAMHIDEAYVVHDPLYHYVQIANSSVHKIKREVVITQEIVADEVSEIISQKNMNEKTKKKLCDFCEKCYLFSVYKADFKNGVFDKIRVKRILKKIDKLEYKSSSFSLLLGYCALKIFPVLAFNLYRVFRMVRGRELEQKRSI